MKKAFISNEGKGGYNITIVHNKKTKYYFVKLNKETGEIIRIGRCNQPNILKETRRINWEEVPEKVRRISFRDIYKGPWDPVKFNIYVYGENKK